MQIVISQVSGMINKAIRWFRTLNYPSYMIFFITARCNAKCKMCFYAENMAQSLGAEKELTLEEYEKISRGIKHINILGISGGEPFIRDDLSEIVKIIYRNCSPIVADIPTNGFFTDKVIRQVEDIAGYCKDMTVDLQLSIDGPEEIHNEIRGLKDSFKRVRETYSRVIALKKKYSNLKVKACTVYSHFNEDHMDELFKILERDFSELDRTVFSVAHGSVSNPEAYDFDWDKYFRLCGRIRQKARVRSIKDFHSIFTLALRIAKNDYLKEILEGKNFYKFCGAGQKVVAIGETGKVFPCEPLWHSLGYLIKNDYDMNRIIGSDEMKEFHKRTTEQKCTCHWGLPMSTALLYKPSYYPVIFSEMIKIALRSLRSAGEDEKVRHVI